MTAMPTIDETDTLHRRDIDDAVLLVMEVLKELGLNTGDLIQADFQPVVRPLLSALNLRVAAPDRLEYEREHVAQFDHIEEQHAARVRHRLRDLNGIAAAQGRRW